MDREEFVFQFQRIVHKYDQFEKQKKCYGTDMLLSVSEIHTIDAIGKVGTINVTQLAECLGITKGSSSQMRYKLVDKELVEKKVSPTSDREVVISLSDKGMVAYKGHIDSHSKSTGKLTKLLLDMPEDTYEMTKTYFDKVEMIIDDMLSGNK